MADSVVDWMMGRTSDALPANVRDYMARVPAFGEGEIIPTGSSRAILDALQLEDQAAQNQPASRTAQLEQALNRVRTRGADYPNAIGDVATPREVPRGTYWPVDYTVPAASPVPAGPQSLIRAVPPQSVSNFNQAVQQLGLTPQEQNLYQHHLSNLWGGGRVVQPGGDVSTVLQAVVQGPDGRYYNIPTVWNGAALPVDAAERQARLAGMGNWPAYATPQEADARYMAMHGLMERDTAAWLAQNPNADPLAALMMRQDTQQHPVLQMLERLRQGQ